MPTADKRSERPGPPAMHPAGIPDDSALPPSEKPKDKTGFLGAPPPVRQAPDRGRAPPRVEPGKKAKPPDPTPPPEETAPTKRGKVVKVEEEVYVPRRERENPEFEESSSEEDEATGEKRKKKKEEDKKPAPAAAPAPAPAAEPVEEEGIIASAEEMAAAKKQREDLGIAKEEEQGDMAVDGAAEEAAEEEEEDAAPVIEMDEDEEEEDAPPTDIPPSMGVSMATSSFVPPPPEVFEPKFDTSRLATELTPGRLTIRCIGGMNVRRKDEVNKVPKQDPFLKFKLGAAERFPYKSTEVQRKTDENPDFQNEIVSFDVLDPREFLFNGDIQLTIECWNKGTFKEEPMGAISVSIVRFMKQPYVAYEERLPLLYPGQKTSSSKVIVELVFEEARPGIFSFKLYEARSLRNVDPMGQQHPFIKFQLGKNYSKRSRTIKDGGTEPYFGEEEVLMWADKESWKDDLQIKVLDEDLGEDKPIAVTQMCLLPYMNTLPNQAKEDWFDMFYYVTDPKDDRVKKEFHQGELQMKVTYYPAGKLNLTVDRARGLMFPDTHEQVQGQAIRMDPYVKVLTDSKAVQIVKRTGADKDGGVDPVWKEELKFDVVDQYQLNFEVINQSLTGTDVLLGNVTLSLLPTFRSGKTEQWLTLKQKKASGGIIEVGAIFVTAEFQGPTGVAYPQISPEVDSFDDTVRKLPSQKPDEAELDKVVVREPYQTDPEQDAGPRNEYGVKKNDLGEEVVKQEFQDHEILAAFNFIDLDHNSFIGAREIRHILVCMGEMITDEEIDCMISMVDMDGDGQVSYMEFRTLVLHPDPGSVDMHKAVNAEKDAAINKERQAEQGKSKATDLSSYQRQRELTTREAKKKSIVGFIAENEATFDFVKQAYQNFLDIAREKRPGGRIQFLIFCECLGVEPLTENKLLFDLFDNEEMGDMDFRELLLGMLNFIEVGKEERMQFSFIMFDELKTGYISHKEVEEILRGNHMIGILSVQRKADTVMRQAASSGAGSITMNEFIVVSKKFPNIMLPSLGSRGKK